MKEKKADVILVMVSVMFIANGIGLLYYWDFEFMPTVTAIVSMTVGLVLFICGLASLLSKTEIDGTTLQKDDTSDDESDDELLTSTAVATLTAQQTLMNLQIQQMSNITRH